MKKVVAVVMLAVFAVAMSGCCSWCTKSAQPAAAPAAAKPAEAAPIK